MNFEKKITGNRRCSFMKGWNIVALTIGIIGAINWGLIGFFNFNLVESLFGIGWLARIIYAAVGLCGLYLLTFYRKTGEASYE
jgi:hypothetical protein